MRKPTKKSREWNRIHERKLIKRKLRHRKTTKTNYDGIQRRYEVPGHPGALTRIICPEVLSLEDNFEKVTEILHKIREHSYWTRKKMYIDFRPIRKVTPSAALILAAELHRANHLNLNRKLRQIDAEKWDPNVRRLLREMGFFKLLRTSSPTDEPEAMESDDRYIEFRSGELVDGEVVDVLRRELDLHISVPEPKQLFSAITEAMTNVRQHAYQDHIPYSTDPKYWWLSASFNTSRKEITVMMYDQGSGVPKTLAKHWQEELLLILPETLVNNHARLIQAAHELSRSSTRERHRGRGFERDIRGYIASLDKGKGLYRIISGRGEYTVESGSGGQHKRRLFKGRLEGTFIQWRIIL